MQSWPRATTTLTVTGLLAGTRKGRLYRGTGEWGLFRQLVGDLLAGVVEGLVRPSSPLADLKRATSDVVWLEPRLVAEVSYSELMEDRLGDPVLRELRVI